MFKATTSSFITEIPLKAGSKEIAILKKRFGLLSSSITHYLVRRWAGFTG